jgi:thiamine-monophosphate kinase
MSECIKDIGEFGLIRRIQRLLSKEGFMDPAVTLGLGDDSASFQPREGCEILVTCDSMVEGRHFLPGKMNPIEIGRRAMTMNISDIGAMGGEPRYALVSLGLKEDTPVLEIDEMYRGFLDVLRDFGASIVGGNITKVDGAEFIDITLIGETERGKVIRRDGARNGDAIVVTGYPGQSAAGLELLLMEDSVESLDDHPLVQAYKGPTHRAREGKAIADSGLASAMIDTSDGFAGDLGHICEGSGLGALLYVDKLPLSEALREVSSEMGKDPFDFVLGSSDDYELIITCDPDNIRRIQTLIKSQSNISVTEVGKMGGAPHRICLCHPDGSEKDVFVSGWDHFLEGKRDAQ